MDNLERDIERAALSYKRSDDGRWASAFYAARVVGCYQLGATLALANRMGVSVDSVENLAHAYFMYKELRSVPKYRNFVRAIRKLPFMYYSSFRALYSAKENYHLTLEQVADILVDLVHAEGTISQRDLDTHIRDRFGDTREWTYFGAKAMKQIHIVLQQPDLPDDVRKVLIPAFEVLGNKS